MEFITTLQTFDGPTYYHHLPVLEEVPDSLLQENRRVIAVLNGALEHPCGLMPNGSGGWFINVNKVIIKKLGLRLGDEVQVLLRKDESKYGLPMPAEFEELLLQDTEGNELFHTLTPGKQRNLLYILGKPKGAEVRLRKAVVVLNYLKATSGNLDFKELNEAFKASK